MSWKDIIARQDPESWSYRRFAPGLGLPAEGPAAAAAADQANQPPPTVGVRSLEQIVSAGDWWNAPGLTWLASNRAGGEGLVMSNLALPEWAGSEFASPQDFYTYYQSLPAEFRPYWVTEQQARMAAATEEEQRRAAALDTLGGQYDRLLDQWSSWRQDPGREMVQEELVDRVNEPVVSDAERAVMERRLAGASAAGRRQLAANAAARGYAGAGPVQTADAQITATTEAAGVQLSAEIAGQNRAAQDRALALLEQTGRADTQLDLAFENLLGGLTSAMAEIEAGGTIQVPDVGAWANLQFAAEAYDESIRQMELDREAAAEAAQRSTLERFAEIASLFRGTGIPELILGF